MRLPLFTLYGLTSAFALLPIGADAASLQEAAAALGAADAKSLEFSGSGHWYQFGQAPIPGGAWPQFEVSSYSASVNFDAPAARVLLTRIQTVEPGRQRPTPTEQKLSWFVNGDKAWNVAPPQGSPDAAPVATPQAAAVEERVTEIWTTPQGFLKAAVANGAKSETSSGGVQVSFTAAGHKYEGFINTANQLEWVRSWIDSPVLGDTLVETKFTEYKDFGGVQFPAELTRVQGGYPVLHLKITAAKLNPGADIQIPVNIASFKTPASNVTVNKLADGVY